MQFLRNLLIALVLSALILFGVERTIRWYTNHGKRINIPNVTKLNYLEAVRIIEEAGLEPIIQDSVYAEGAKRMTITEQDPDPGREVKEGRKIYLTINSLSKPKVRMPKLQDNSLNLAKAILINSGLELGNITERYSLLGSGVVIKQLYNNDSIVSGKLIERGSRIDLLVSKYIDVDSVLIQGIDSNMVDGWQYKSGIMNDRSKKNFEKMNKADSSLIDKL